jgi:hypothetical protein
MKHPVLTTKLSECLVNASYYSAMLTTTIRNQKSSTGNVNVLKNNGKYLPVFVSDISSDFLVISLKNVLL